MIQNSLYPDLKKANRFIDNKLYKEFIRNYLEKDDTLITLVGNGIANLSLAPEQLSVIIQNTLGLRCKKNVDKKFLYYLLLNNQDILLKLDRGMAQPSIRKDEILNIEFLVPSLLEQQKVSTILEKLDNKINNNNNKLLKMYIMKKSLLQQMFI